MSVNLMQGDCIERMQEIPDGSIDAVIADPPYGTTACKWDTVIDLPAMWAELKRIVKPNGAIVLFGSEPFSSALRMSNIKQYKYDWVWRKDKGANFASCKKTPMKVHECISVFAGGLYYPQMQKRPEKNKRNNAPRVNTSSQTDSVWLCEKSRGSSDEKYPESVQVFNACREYLHPTQKPVALMAYLIKTYTNEGETVLDFTMGSGTTGVACVNTGRSFIGIELDPGYFEIAKQRIEVA